jgi:perosamine synthetase
MENKMGLIKLPENSIAFFKDNLDEIFESGALAEGSWNQKVSDFAQSYCGAKCAVPTASNGSGLVALLQLYKEYHGRTEVYLQSNTMYGVKTLVNSAGLDIVGYIDCDLSTLMPSLDDVERTLRACQNKAATAILLSHIGGIVNPDMEAIAALCKENNVILLEDCAHSFGATLQGKHSGTFGDAGVYSFYATKAIPTGEGGVAITNDEEIGAALVNYVKYDRFDQKMNVGVNVRQSEMHALMTYAVMKEVDTIIRDKSAVASRYVEMCQKHGIRYISQEESGVVGNYYKFIVLAKNEHINETLPALETVTSKVYDYCLGNTMAITTNHACLPIWYAQPDEMTDKVIEELKKSVA